MVTTKIQHILPLFISIVFWIIFPCFSGYCENNPVNTIFIIEHEGPVNPGASTHITDGLAKGKDLNAHLIVLRLDTPGGLASSMRTIIKAILNSPIPVIVYVGPKGAGAASAGVMITMAGHIAAMAPGTNIGAAHPVNADGGDINRTMSEKVTNDMASYARGIAENRGRNGAWVEEAIRQSVSITAEEAVEKKVIDLVAEDIKDLLEKVNKREVTLPQGKIILNTDTTEEIYYRPGFRVKILQIISDPNIAYILMLIGLAGLYFEMSHPGTILPGVIGGISLILAFYSFQTLPVNYAGLLLIALAIIFFIADIKITSYGILSIGGVISLTIGSIMLFEDVGVSFRLIIPTAILSGIVFSFIAFLAFKAHRHKPKCGFDGLTGETGIVKKRIDGEGLVFVRGEYWKASSDEIIEVGESVVIETADGMRLKVRKAIN